MPTTSGTIYAALNKAYVREDAVLHDGDEVAFFPPVSGGQDRRLFEITVEPLSLDDVASRVASPGHGAITVFAGMVRGETDLDSPFAAAPPEVTPADGGTRLVTDFLEYEGLGDGRADAGRAGRRNPENAGRRSAQSASCTGSGVSRSARPAW
ncbi:MAG: MoaD/ThiS family protein [Anaerolineae bacterium]|nr:MoaD/ThiS family protein [Anaerolineae bacterium]